VSLLLRECGDTLLLRKCGTSTLLTGCRPKNICTEYLLNPSLTLDITISGIVTCCTDCFDVDYGNGFKHGARVKTCPGLVKTFTNVAWNEERLFDNPAVMEIPYWTWPQMGGPVDCNGYSWIWGQQAQIDYWQEVTSDVRIKWIRPVGTDAFYIMVWADGHYPSYNWFDWLFADTWTPCPYFTEGVYPLSSSGCGARRSDLESSEFLANEVFGVTSDSSLVATVSIHTP
jgi:hypothetical protein